MGDDAQCVFVLVTSYASAPRHARDHPLLTGHPHALDAPATPAAGGHRLWQRPRPDPQVRWARIASPRTTSTDAPPTRTQVLKMPRLAQPTELSNASGGHYKDPRSIQRQVSTKQPHPYADKRSQSTPDPALRSARPPPGACAPRSNGPSTATVGTTGSSGMQRGGTWPMEWIQTTHRRGHRRADMGLRRAKPTQKPSLTQRRIQVCATTYELAHIPCNELRALHIPMPSRTMRQRGIVL